jgi:hypothetical protein
MGLATDAIKHSYRQARVDALRRSVRSRTNLQPGKKFRT